MRIDYPGSVLFRYTARTRADLATLPANSKKLWKKQHELEKQKTATCGTPALVNREGLVAQRPDSKANFLRDGFSTKSSVPASFRNEYTNLQDPAIVGGPELSMPTKDDAARAL